MEILQQSASSWFLDRSLFLEDPILSSREEPIYCHILSGVMAKEYSLKLSAFEYETNLELYKWRFGCKEGIVPIFSIQLVKSGRGQATIVVLCEKLFFAGSHFFGKLTITNQLYIFLSLLKSAREISSKVGPFKLTPNMFALNKQGQCKLWPHHNNANNQPQYPLPHHLQMYAEIVHVLTSLGWNSQEFETVCRRLKKEDFCFDRLEKIIGEFRRKKDIRAVEKVEVTDLVKMSQEQGDCRYSELSCRPSFTFKSHESTALTNSLQLDSMSQDSCGSSSLPLRSLLPKYSLKIPDHPNKHKKNQQSTLTTKPVHEFKTNINLPKASLISRFNPSKSLGVDTKLQESILIESDIKSKEKVGTFDLNSLEKLGKIGRFCQSVTAEELILQEFQDIYY